MRKSEEKFSHQSFFAWWNSASSSHSGKAWYSL